MQNGFEAVNKSAKTIATTGGKTKRFKLTKKKKTRRN